MRYCIIILTIFFLFFNSQNIYSQEFLKTKIIETSIENDFLNVIGKRTDRYYSSGMNLTIYYFQNQSKRHLLDNSSLSFRSDTMKRYSWGITQKIYTPDKVYEPNHLLLDWTYAGTLYVTHAIHSINPKKNTALTSEIWVGILGPASLAEEAQWDFHKLIRVRTAKGWESEIQTSIILNYNLKIERKLFSNNFCNLNVNSDATFGTLLNQGGAGLQLRLGKLNNYFDWAHPNSAFYFTFSSNLNCVLYNTYLQGNLFTPPIQTESTSLERKLPASEINNFYTENSLGVNYISKRISLSYKQVFWSPFTKHTERHSYGSVTLAMNVR